MADRAQEEEVNTRLDRADTLGREWRETGTQMRWEVSQVTDTVEGKRESEIADSGYGGGPIENSILKGAGGE
jgi:hypothetical protein